MCVSCGADVSDLDTHVCENCQKEKDVFLIGFIHTKNDCIKNGNWRDGEFRCRKCNRLMAFAYKIGNEIKIWKFPNFKRVKIIDPDINFIGEITFTDFEDYMAFLKQEFYCKVKNNVV